jgi:hypothetical protein
MYYCGWVVCTLLLEAIVCEIYKRHKRFKQWYAKLRLEGWDMWDSFRWALHNSGTHTIDGKNL